MGQNEVLSEGSFNKVWDLHRGKTNREELDAKPDKAFGGSLNITTSAQNGRNSCFLYRKYRPVRWSGIYFNSLWLPLYIHLQPIHKVLVFTLWYLNKFLIQPSDPGQNLIKWDLFSSLCQVSLMWKHFGILDPVCNLSAFGAAKVKFLLKAPVRGL